MERDKNLDKLSDLTNRSYGQTLFLFELLDRNFKKLVLLEQKLANNLLGYCPDDREECEKVLAMGDCTGWVFTDERYSHLDDFLEKEDKIGKECTHIGTGWKGKIKYELPYTPDPLKRHRFKPLFVASWGIFWYHDPERAQQYKGIPGFWHNKDEIKLER